MKIYILILLISVLLLVGCTQQEKRASLEELDCSQTQTCYGAEFNGQHCLVLTNPDATFWSFEVNECILKCPIAKKAELLEHMIKVCSQDKIDELQEQINILKEDMNDEREARSTADSFLWRGRTVSNDDVALELENVVCQEAKNFGSWDYGIEEPQVKATIYAEDSIQYDFMYPYIGHTLVAISKNKTSGAYTCLCLVNDERLDECRNFTQKLYELNMTKQEVGLADGKRK